MADITVSSPAEVTYGEEQAVRLIQVEWELLLRVPIQQAWDRTVGEFDAWWPHTYKDGSSVFIEAFPGGRIWERFPDGVNGSVWGNIVYIEPPLILKNVGNWAMPGMALSSGIWRFSEVEGGTLMKSSGQMLGALDVALLKERKGGTPVVISALKDWVENGVRARVEGQ